MNICGIWILDLNQLQRVSIKYLYMFEDFFGLDNFLNFSNGKKWIEYSRSGV